MALEGIIIYGGVSLLNNDGGSAINPNDTDGVLVDPPPPGPFTIGSGDPVFTNVDDNGTGSLPGGTAENFEDGVGIAQFLAEPLTLTYQGGGGPVTQTFPAGTRIQAEFRVNFSSGYSIVGVRLGTGSNLVTAGFVVIPPPGGDPTPPPGFSLGTVVSTQDQPSIPWADVPCFVAGTRILTSKGALAIETLVAGDVVLGPDGAEHRLAWVGSVTLEPAETLFQPALWPVVFPAGAIGNAVPLRLSPQHRVVLAHPVAELVMDAPEVLAPATLLVGLAGVETRRPSGPLTYVHLLVDGHAIVLAEGAAVETLLLTDRVRDTLLSRMEGGALRPDLAEPDPALPIARRAEAQVIFAGMTADGRAQAVARLAG